MEVVKFLLESGADVNVLTDRSESTLHWAASSHSLELVKLILSSIEPSLTDKKNHKGFTSLHFSAAKGNFDFYVELIQHKANIFIPNNYGATVLHWSCLREGNLPSSNVSLAKQRISDHLIEQLTNSISDLAFLNRMNKIGRTSLHWACISEYDTIVLKLLNKNCDPDISMRPYNSVLDDIKNNKMTSTIATIFQEKGFYKC